MLYQIIAMFKAFGHYSRRKLPLLKKFPSPEN